MLKNLSIKNKLSVLMFLFVAGIVAYGIQSYRVLETVKVNGPIYKNIVQGKDIIADILPPPEYIIESYLLTFQMLDEKDSAKLQKLVERCKSLRDEYETRHEYWNKDLADSEIKDLLVNRAYKPAIEFYEIRDSQFLPAILNGDRAKGWELVNGSLREKYEEHRAQIDEVVRLAAIRNSEDEKAAAAYIAESTWMLIGLGVGVVALCCGISWVLAGTIRKPLDEAVVVLEAVAKGDLTKRLQVDSNDEVGRMGKALNCTLDSMGSTLKTINKRATTLGSSSQQMIASSQKILAYADEAHSQANEASERASGLHRSFQSVVNHISELNGGSDDLRSTVCAVAEKSEKVAADIPIVAHAASLTTGSANETLDAATELAKMAGELQQMVAQFRH